MGKKKKRGPGWIVDPVTPLLTPEQVKNLSDEERKFYEMLLAGEGVGD